MCISARDKPAAIDQAGVIFGVGEDGIAAFHQCRHRAQVGGETGGEHQRRFGSFELGQPALQLGVRCRVPGNQRARARAPAFALGPLACAARLAARRRQAQVIVGAEN